MKHGRSQWLTGLAACLAWLFTHAIVGASTELKTWDNCRLISTKWADGDSFLVENAAGDQHTLRLYGVDCIEWHVSSETLAKRLREQRRYFGIALHGGSTASSVAEAKQWGERAAKEVAQVLSQPFRVDTGMADARGDARNKRIYAFVTLASGEDLGEWLVRHGLARAFGLVRRTPDGRSAKEYREFLKDLELQAAKRGTGIWSITDWDQLPDERKDERQESEDLAIATEQSGELGENEIDINTASIDKLTQLPGVGPATAQRIISARPFNSPDDLLRVHGIGSKTLEKMRPYLTASSTPPESPR
ncbi:MAG: helix-hairpin-helix domain-containing protein [Luteolibacter sp.]